MSNPRYYTTEEIAEMLHITKQSAINYFKDGTIKSKKIKGKHYVNAEYFDSVMPQVNNITELKPELEAIETNIKHAIRERNEELKNREDDNSWLHLLRSEKVPRDLLSLIVASLGYRYLTERQENIILDLLNKKPAAEIAHNHHITKDRVMQIFQKAVKTLSGLRSYSVILDENDALINENSMLSKVCSDLKKENDILRIQKGMPKDSPITKDDIEQAKLMKEKITDMNISVRAIHCLKAAEVETIGDLVSHTKKELLECRNLGKKSLRELDELLESLGLHFGMDIKPLIKKYSLYLASKHHGRDNKEHAEGYNEAVSR